MRVTPADSEPVYALSVHEHHEYFANGILVSNCDAGLYGWRRCYAFLSERPKPPPAPGSDAWAAQEAERMEREALEAYQQRQEANEASGWEEWQG